MRKGAGSCGIGRYLVGLALFGLALAGPTAPALAKRIVVMEVEGARTSELAESLAALLAGKHRVIASKVYRKAAARLNAEKLNPQDVARVATYIEADGVLLGMLQAENDGYVFRLRLREGATGRTIKKLAVRLNRPRLSRSMQRQLALRLLGAIGKLPAVDGGDDIEVAGRELDDDEELDDPSAGAPRGKKRARRLAAVRPAGRRPVDMTAEEEEEPLPRRDRAGRGARATDPEEEGPVRGRGRVARDAADDEAEEPEDRVRRRGRGRAGDELEDEVEEDRVRRRGRGARRDDDREALARSRGHELDIAAEEEEPLAGERAAGARGDAPAGGTVEAGVESSLLRASDRRNTGLVLSAGLGMVSRELGFTTRADLATPPPGYESAFVPTGHVDGEWYPLARRRGALSGLGLGARFERVFRLRSAVEGAPADLRLTTVYQRYGASARYRHHFGDRDSLPSLVAHVGYQRMVFQLDKAAAGDVQVLIPNTSYSYVDPGVTLRVPLGQRLAVNASAMVLLVLNTGEIQSPDWYGGAKVTAGEGDVNVEVAVTSRLRARLGGRFSRLAYDFVGNGMMAYAMDGDAASQDIGGAVDRYLGLYLTAGMSL